MSAKDEFADLKQCLTRDDWRSRAVLASSQFPQSSHHRPHCLPGDEMRDLICESLGGWPILEVSLVMESKCSVVVIGAVG